MFYICLWFRCAFCSLFTVLCLVVGGYPPGIGMIDVQPFEGCIETIMINKISFNPLKQAERGEDIEQCN